MATSVPEPIAIPRSARARAGASFTPSPTIATRCPAACSSATIRPCRRAGLGADLVDAEIARDRLCDAARIAGHEQGREGRRAAARRRHRGPRPSACPRARRCRPVRHRWSRQGPCGLFLVPCEEPHRELGEAVRARERRIADPDVVPIDRRVYALPGQRLERAWLGKRDALRRRELDHRGRERMLGSRLGAREDAGSPRPRRSRARFRIVDDLWPADGERPGLVERDHVDRPRRLESLRAFRPGCRAMRRARCLR